MLVVAENSDTFVWKNLAKLKPKLPAWLDAAGGTVSEKEEVFSKLDELAL